MPLLPSISSAPAGLALVSSAVLASLLTSGCRPANEAAAAAASSPPEVTVASVESRELIEWNEFIGRAEAMEMVDVRPRVSGHIQEVRFQSGQLVKKGDVLFVIDPRWHQAQFDLREAECQQAQVRLETMEREAARTEQLLEKKAISTEEAEQRQARFREAKAALLAAEAARDTARLDLDYTRVRAPIDGRVSRALITAGNYVSGLAGAAALLTTLVSVGPIYVYADVDENTLLKLNTLRQEGGLATNGQGKIPVELQLADEEGFPHRGHIESFDNRLDARTGSIVVRAVFPNPEDRIVPGLFARLRLPVSPKAPVLLVEETAIGTDQAQKFVLTLTSTNTAAYRSVVLGPPVDDKRIIRSGLQAGEKVIVVGLARVRPGMEVSPQEVATETASHGNLSLAERR